METGLILGKRGDKDDIVLTINIRRPMLTFVADIYVSELELRGQLNALNIFLEDLVDGGRSLFALELGPQGGASPSARVQFDLLRSGNLTVAAELCTIVPCVYGGVFDRCLVHLATDISSLDNFAKELRELIQGSADKAVLAGFEVSRL